MLGMNGFSEERSAGVEPAGTQVYGRAEEAALDALADAWDDLQSAAPGAAAQAARAMLADAAQQMADFAASRGCRLLHELAGSLAQYGVSCDLESAAMPKVIQTHIDALCLALHENITDDKAEQADELRLIITRCLRI